MLEQQFLQCASELCSQDFNRISFLKSASYLAPQTKIRSSLLILYAMYHLMHRQDYKRCLQLVEQCLQLKPSDVIVSVMLSIKAAVLTYMQKHTEALQTLKEALSIATKAIFIEEMPHIRQVYPMIMARILDSLNLSRGRREFLVFLDGVRVRASQIAPLRPVQQAAIHRLAEIREKMRCGCREEAEQSSMESLAMTKKEGTPYSSLYISRLYDERKSKLGKREGSAKKQQIDPYQWRQKEERPQGDCQYM